MVTLDNRKFCDSGMSRPFQSSVPGLQILGPLTQLQSALAREDWSRRPCVAGAIDASRSRAIDSLR